MTISSTEACGESCDAAKIILAISSASIIRLGSMLLPLQESVYAAPGMTCVTLIPCGFISSLKFLLKPYIANLLMLYAPPFLYAWSEAMEHKLKICPLFAFIIADNTVLVK